MPCDHRDKGGVYMSNYKSILIFTALGIVLAILFMSSKITITTASANENLSGNAEHDSMLASLVARAPASDANANVSVADGHYNHGKILNANNIHKWLKSNPDKFVSVSPEEFQFGVQRMQDVLTKLAEYSLAIQSMPLRVGDISKKQGGKLALHMTHQIGLDADVGYLLKKVNETGHRHQSFHNRFTEKLVNKNQVSENFDADANIKLFTRMFDELPVNKIFVGCELYKVLAPKMEKNQPKALARIFAQEGHDDHFHVRAECPVEHANCSEDWWDNPNEKPKPQTRKKKYHGDKWNGCGWWDWVPVKPAAAI